MFIKKEKKNVYHVSKSLNGWFVLFYTLTRKKKKISDTRKNSEISEHLGSLILILFWFNWIKNKNNMHTYKKEENIKKKWNNKILGNHGFSCLLILYPHSIHSTNSSH